MADKVAAGASMFYLMRHAEAGAFGVTDEERELTGRGVRQAEAQGRALNEFLIDQTSPAADRLPSLKIIQSSYLRAQQTAELLIQNVSFLDKEPLTVKNISPENSLEDVLEALSKCFIEMPEQHFIVVCHMPVVAMLDGHCRKAAGDKGDSFSTAELRRYRFEDQESYRHLVGGGCDQPVDFLEAHL